MTPPLVPADRERRARRVNLGLMATATAVLVPWVGYLALTLPDDYQAQNWSTTWVGFDVGLVVLMAATVVLGLLKRVAIVLSACATGALLACDAWFDVMTSTAADRPVALASALLLELPLAGFLVHGSAKLLQILVFGGGPATAVLRETVVVPGPGRPAWQTRGRAQGGTRRDP